MISFGSAASCHSGLIPLKTVYKNCVLYAIASKKNVINLHSAVFATVLARSMLTNFALFTKPLDRVFFINVTIPGSIVSKYTLQVSRTLKTGKTFK